MVKEIECRVAGKVQVVMFRDFVHRKARSLNIVGEVENMDDRSVRVLAQGEEVNLEKLIEHLHKGPFLARVVRVDVVWREPQDQFAYFKIVY